ncbi:hypothetical protein [Variovorax sp. dw_308]|uniref:hypothetical protein n=1 Tax=Variovorax sp. dw_308 TaxID=2721546 RepID=UPI001C467621|nr:hypothetical protein [Variovorax sp. dw_308]
MAPSSAGGPEFNDRVSAEQMKGIAQERYDEFDARRRRAEAVASDDVDLATLDAIQKKVSRTEGEK